MAEKLVAKGLRKAYKRREVVRGVDFEIHSGEVVGLLGPNGAGKTTSFYMIVGLIHADQGEILLDDLDLAPLPMYRRALAGISYLAQEPTVFRKLTVTDNLLAILECQDISTVAMHEKAERLLKEFRLQHVARSFGYTLSGGERRRLEIARALTTDPFFMLLDEPFAGIDPLAVLDIQKTVADLKKRGIGILISDHNVRETLNVCDRAYILNEGEIIEAGTPEQIAASPRARSIYLGESFRL
ncbi:MAG: LPS export ABC transporter ATP-binding protein [Deltaproteobacteria bacterium]|nr:LPS export ABC transporter ATP-binding protein [Deltaproteobacteria bacterium]